jgi:hypothetical protein
MSWNPDLYWLLYEQRRAELERAAEIERLIAEGRPDRPSLTERWLSRVGDVLITTGLRLRAYALDNQSGFETAP